MSTQNAPRPAAAVLISGDATGGRMSLIEMQLYQGEIWPRHSHHFEDEMVYVLAGQVALFANGKWQLLSQGQAVVISRKSEHTLAAVSHSARLLAMFAPAGFEEFYRELDGEITWTGNLEHLVATAARYGCEITGPHPGWPAQLLDEKVR